MIKKFTLISAVALLTAGSLYGQRLQPGYVTWPSSTSLHTYINAWNSNGVSISGWEDENFFISRVKPRTRLVNRNVQVYSTINASTDKRYLNWVPYGNNDDNGVMTNALQNGNFDQECFTMWSYIDHWGDWTSPYGWAPGALADVAHKNGVAVSGVASVPNTAISSEWSTCLNGVANITHNNVSKFLYYHGVDGLGYNSEWTSGLTPTNLISLHNDIMTYMNGKNPIFENVWYGGVNDSGSCTFDSGITNYTKLFAGASIFLNYNWQSTISGAVSTANSQSVKKNRDSSETRNNGFWVYAGMNQQGGEPKSGDNYPSLAPVAASIGMWGAHQYNMFWQDRNAKGSQPRTKAETYADYVESWYTNGAKNPAVRKTIATVRNHRPVASWAGISSMVSERSTLNHTIASEPFVTYFNVGNGMFFNEKGKRISDNEWYSIGIQDYQPTWRWWFAPTWFAQTVTEGSTKLSAKTTWDDAYFGGSCIEISGTTTTEYLHLLKSQFTVARNQKIKVYYKLLEGEGEVNVVFANGKTPSTMQEAVVTNGASGARALFTVANSATTTDKSYEEGWQCCEMTFATAVNQQFNATNQRLGVIGLEFKNCKNMKMLLGGIEILPASNTTTPNAPTLTTAKVLSNTYTGIDGKLVWNMTNSVSDRPCYNADVNTSMFKMYAQEEGGEEVFVGATTSWAGFVFRGPNENQSAKIRFGVSAVSMDMQTESAITWSSYMSKGTYQASEEVLVDKTIIKPSEAFRVYYADESHGSATWKITDLNGNTVASGSGIELNVPNGLPTTGGYDVTVTYNGTSTTYGYFVQVSSDATGALPEIYTIKRNATDVTNGGSEVNVKLVDGTHTTDALSYTGRKADGSASRGLALNKGRIGAKVSDLGISQGNSFSFATWIRYTDMPSGTYKFFDIVNPTAAWPNLNWGFIWTSVIDGQPYITMRGNATDSSSPGELQYTFANTKLKQDVWTHVAVVVDYKSTSQVRIQLYINGVKQASTWKAFNKWNSGNGGTLQYSGTTDDYCSGRSRAYISSSDYILFGGQAYQGDAADALLDDFQIWNKAMTEADVKESMQGYTSANLNSNIITFWDFENDALTSDGGFKGIGTKTATCYACEFEGEAEASRKFTVREPSFVTGCPFLAGTAYPVVTTANWKDSVRGTTFNKTASRAASTEGEAGSATATFTKKGDHTVTLNLENGYGTASMDFPVFHVEETSAIGEIGVDESDVRTYTVGKQLYLEFAADGDYRVEVYNTAGVKVADKQLSAAAGQNAEITLGSAGVYLIRVARDGRQLRALKVLSK